MKFKLDDLVLIIPFRLDTIVRLENLLLVIDNLTNNFIVKVVVVEANVHKNIFIKKLLPESVEYYFYYDDDPIFFRTHYINMVCKNIQNKIIGVWDTDVIIHPKQLIEAMELLRSGEADFVYPYDKYFLDTSPILRKMFLKNQKIEFLLQNMKKMKEMYTPNPLGGAFLANLDSYIESGLENEDFYGWGMEDGERFYRWESMGYKIKRVPGPLFHLSHPRGQNSAFHDADQQIIKRKEVMRAKRKRPLRDNITKT